VDEVILPGAEGSFGVLPGHHPMLAALAPGVAICKNAGETDVMAIGSGFAEVGADRVSVLAETCEKAAEIDKDRARRKLDELQSRLASEVPAGEVEVLRVRMLKHLARLNASERAS
jgi:F-type H+-transporting ATPase subunit epsilon